MAEITIKQLIEKIDNKEIYINLDFINPEDEAFSDNTQDLSYDIDGDIQRTVVWPKENWNKLIYSLLKDFPIPNLILIEKDDYKDDFKYSIVDGKQRIHTIYSFIKNHFFYSDKRDSFPQLKMKKFEEFSDEWKEELLSRKLSITYVKGKTPEEHKEIFELLNTNAIPLNHQEIRHAIYHGQITKLLNSLNAQDDFNDIINELISIGLFTRKLRVRRKIDEFFVNLFMMLKERNITAGSKNKIESFYSKYDSSETVLFTQDDIDEFIYIFKDSINLFKRMKIEGMEVTAVSKTTLYMLFYIGAIELKNLNNIPASKMTNAISSYKNNMPDNFISSYRYWTSGKSREILKDYVLNEIS